MVEIRNILKSGNQEVFDNELSWGACLSSYEEKIEKLPVEEVPVFIELKRDCHYPEHAIFIDHHDEKAGEDEKTSIEQVADLLKIKLDRRQQLISANDKGHIRAMQKLCASPEEIEEIRDFVLYSLIFLTNAFLSNSYLSSISIHKELRVLITFVVSVIIAESVSGNLAK